MNMLDAQQSRCISADFVVQDARQFSLLTSKPDTQISSSSSAPESFSLRSARFVLTVADNRDVTWQCRVSTSGTWDGGKVSGMTTVPAPGSTGASAWQACTTPQVICLPLQSHAKSTVEVLPKDVKLSSVWPGRFPADYEPSMCRARRDVPKLSILSSHARAIAAACVTVT